jgi:hypothetical protein
LRDIFVIAELEHELVGRLGILLDRKALPLASFREAKVGQRQCDNVERGLAVVTLWQFVDDLGDFKEATGP